MATAAAKKKDTTKNEKPGVPAEPATEGKVIQLPALEIRTMRLRVVGISSLITHAWSEKAKKMMRDKQQKMARLAREAKDPKSDFESAKYIDENGKDCVPAMAFRNAIVSAARFAEGVHMTTLRGAIFIKSNMVPIQYDKCVMREDMVRVGGKGKGTGTADLRYRPEYIGWRAELELEYNANVLSAEQVVNLVRLAGFSIGICEWRPERDGQFGRFEVDTN